MLKKQWIFFGLITAIQTIVFSSKKLIGTTRTPHTQLLILKVDIDVSTNDSGITLYELPQSEVDRIERNLQGGSDSDIDRDNDSTSEEEDDRPPRELLQ